MRPLNKLMQWVRSYGCTPDGEVVNKDHVEAARNLIVDENAKIWAKYKASEINFEGVHPEIMDFTKAFLKHTRKRSIPCRAFELTRSMQRQQELYLMGFSNAPAGFSPHQLHDVRQMDGDRIKYEGRCSMAVDIIHCTKAWNLDRYEWDVLGAIGKEIARKRNIKMSWGGDFKSRYDPAHWELECWEDFVI